MRVLRHWLLCWRLLGALAAVSGAMELKQRMYRRVHIGSGPLAYGTMVESRWAGQDCVFLRNIVSNKTDLFFPANNSLVHFDSWPNDHYFTTCLFSFNDTVIIPVQRMDFPNIVYLMNVDKKHNQGMFEDLGWVSSGGYHRGSRMYFLVVNSTLVASPPAYSSEELELQPVAWAEGPAGFVAVHGDSVYWSQINQLRERNLRTSTTITLFRQQAMPVVRAIELDREGNLFACTEQGLWEITGSDYVAVRFAEECAAILFLRNGNILLDDSESLSLYLFTNITFRAQPQNTTSASTREDPLFTQYRNYRRVVDDNSSKNFLPIIVAACFLGLVLVALAVTYFSRGGNCPYLLGPRSSREERPAPPALPPCPAPPKCLPVRVC